MNITSNNLIATRGILDGSAWDINADYYTELQDISSFSSTNVPPNNSSIFTDISFWYALYQLKTNWNRVRGTFQADTIWSYLEQFKFLRGPIESLDTAPSTDSVRQTDPYWMGDRYYTATSDFTANYTGADKSRRIIWLLNHFMAEVGSIENVYAGLKHFKDKQWEDVGLDIKGARDLASGGLVQLLLSSGTTNNSEVDTLAAQLRPGETLDDVVDRRVKALTVGLRNLGTLFDVADLASMGKPKTLIENLYGLGLSKLGDLHGKILALEVADLDDVKDVYLLQILREIKGNALAEIIQRTGVKLPAPERVTTVADLLVAENIFSKEVLDELPNGSMEGLANFLGKVPGQYNTFEDIIELLESIEVPDIANLAQDEQPLPQADYDALVAGLPLGSGIFDNPTVADFFEPLTGINTHAGFKIFNELNRRLYDVVGYSTIYTLYTPGSGSHTWRNAWVTTLQALFESGMNDVLARCEAEYIKFEKQTTITSNIMNAYFGQALATPDQYFTTVTDTDPSVFGLVTGITQWGQETNFGFSDILLKLAADNRFGDAVVASLKDGRAKTKQRRKGAPLVGVKDTQSFKSELSNAQIDVVRQELETAKQKLNQALDRGESALELRIRVDQLTEEFKTLRDRPGVQVVKKTFQGDTDRPENIVS